jgi:hypothetical protein
MRRFPRTAVAIAMVVCGAISCGAAPRASEASCRQAVNGLISLLDANNDNTSLYRDTFAVVVNTCGPSGPKPEPKPDAAPPARDGCHDLAAALVDLIEDGKMNTAAFAKMRGDFVLACPPR